MIVRLSKILMVFLTGLYALFVAANNILDYDTNFVALRHVMAMDTVLPTSSLTWRAVTSAPVHHAAYWLIIGFGVLRGQSGKEAAMFAPGPVWTLPISA